MDNESRGAAPLTKEETAQAVKEGLKEWLDEKILTFGRWTLRGLAAAGFAAIMWVILKSHGFQFNP